MKINLLYTVRFCILCTLISFGLMITSHASANDKTFVGSESCMDCHKNEYSNFSNYTKKAHSYDSIRVMQPKLTEAEFKSCFECHTTGYGQPGGFVSESETPALKNAGCEVCHGPGSLHIESQDPEDIKTTLSIEDCNRCHSEERVNAFDFKPLLFGGAH
ncbi:MAG: cytochrome c family protein [Desulfamplus sp.]|nr:cytochrome c family protein [Desulfamplus sp.]